MSLTLIASSVLSSATNTVTFSSIPNTFGNLLIISSNNTATTGNVLTNLRFNGDTGNNYIIQSMFGTGSSASAASSQNASSVSTDATAANRCAVSIEIIEYASSKLKTGLFRYDAFGNVTDTGTFRWNDTSAITSVTIFTSINNYAAGSTFYLYGIPR